MSFRHLSIVILAMSFVASCSNSSTTLRHPETGKTAICAYSGWGWLGAPMAASMYADCKTKYQQLGYVKESDLGAYGRTPSATPTTTMAQPDRVATTGQPDVPPFTSAPSPPVVSATSPRPEAAPAAPRISPGVSAVPVNPSEPRSEQLTWILGSWQAVEGKSGTVEGTGRFDFRREGSELKWRMRRSGWFSGIRTTQEASGTVSRISDTTAELTGRYSSSNLGVVGQTVRHSLTLDGNHLRGFELSEDGTQSAWSLQRVR